MALGQITKKVINDKFRSFWTLCY